MSERPRRLDLSRPTTVALRTLERLRQRVRTMALITSEGPRRQDLSQPHNSGIGDDGLQNVGKAEVTRSRPVKFSHMTVAMRMVALLDMG